MMNKVMWFTPIPTCYSFFLKYTACIALFIVDFDSACKKLIFLLSALRPPVLGNHIADHHVYFHAGNTETEWKNILICFLLFFREIANIGWIVQRTIQFGHHIARRILFITSHTPMVWCDDMRAPMCGIEGFLVHCNRNPLHRQQESNEYKR